MNILDRRRFLKSSFAAGGLLSASAFGATAPVSPGNRITLGCIGVGGKGTNNLNAFLRIPETQVVAVCDVERETDTYLGGGRHGLMPAKALTEKFYGEQERSGSYKGCDTYSDFRELLARDDIDAVVVSTPDHWHSAISVAAAKAGKDIYCEKALANTVAGGRAICDAVEGHGRILQTGSHERSGSNARYACELVRNGRIGKLHTIRVCIPYDNPHHLVTLENNEPKPVKPVPSGFDYDTWVGPAPWRPYADMHSHFWWRFNLDFGGGEMTDRGAHVIDLAQLGNGSDHTGPIQISGNGKALGGGPFNSFFDYSLECLYANGVRMTIENKGPRGVKFEGSDGWIFIAIHGGDLSAEPASLLQEKIGRDEIHLGRSPGHHKNFIDSVISRRPPVAPAEVGHRTASICHLGNIALITGCKIDWDPDAEVCTNNPDLNRYLSRTMREPWK